MKVIYTASPTETEKLGEKIGKVLKEGDIVALYGELGAGKTVLVKGIVRGIGIEEEVKSPSFTIVATYKNKKIVHHIDLFRLSVDEIPSIDFEDFIKEDAIAIVEWADRAEQWLPPQKIEVRIEIINSTKRRFTIKGWIENFI